MRQANIQTSDLYGALSRPLDSFENPLIIYVYWKKPEHSNSPTTCAYVDQKLGK